MAPDLTLYNLRGCPFCKRVKDVLAQLGLEYDEIQVAPFRMMRKEVKRLSGQRRVPVLVDGEHVIADSQAICGYLASRYGSRAGSGSGSIA